METAVVKQESYGVVNFEDYAMPIDSLVRQVAMIQKVMVSVMKKDEHYGVIPGTIKPSLLKPGAEKLCLVFRLEPDYYIIKEVRDKDFIAYTVKCILTHIPTGQKIASGIGSCNSREAKYRYRHVEEITDQQVPQEYWKAKQAGNSKEMKRLLGDGMRVRKDETTGKWMVAKSAKVDNDNPWDLDNTLIKMACKRALIAAVLNATAASDIFTQDVEDLPAEYLNGKAEPTPAQKPEPPAKPAPPREDIPEHLDKTTDQLMDEAPGIAEGDTGMQGEKHPIDFTKTKAAAGFDKGMAVICPDRPKGKNLTQKGDCNQCHKAATCLAWAM